MGGPQSFGPADPGPSARVDSAQAIAVWTGQELAAGGDTDRHADVATVSAARMVAGALPDVILGDSHSHCYSKPVMVADTLLAPIHTLCSGGSVTRHETFLRRSLDVFPHPECIEVRALFPLLSGAGVVDRAWTAENVGHDHHLSPQAVLAVLELLIARHAARCTIGTSP